MWKVPFIGDLAEKQSFRDVECRVVPLGPSFRFGAEEASAAPGLYRLFCILFSLTETFRDVIPIYFYFFGWRGLSNAGS